jgi:hypothetical protein
LFFPIALFCDSLSFAKLCYPFQEQIALGVMSGLCVVLWIKCIQKPSGIVPVLQNILHAHIRFHCNPCLDLDCFLIIFCEHYFLWSGCGSCLGLTVWAIFPLSVANRTARMVC